METLAADQTHGGRPPFSRSDESRCPLPPESLTPPHPLAHVSWIGGPPDAGKSTVAQILADRLGARFYQQDRHEREHLRWATPDRHPLHVEFRHQLETLDEAGFAEYMWVQRSVPEIATASRANWVERLDLVCADLVDLGATPPIIAEGPGLFPAPLLHHLPAGAHVVWLIPTDEFKQASHRRRGKSAWAHLTSDPDRARRQHIERDLLLAEMYRTELRALGRPWITIDGQRSVESIADQILKEWATKEASPGSR